MACHAGPDIVEDNLVFALDAGNTKSFNINNGDLNFSNVSLLLKGDGTNGSTNITDSSSNAHSVTANGDAQISTNQSKFGGSSLYFDGNGDYLTSPTNTDFEFGTGDFTVEFWTFFNSIGRVSVTLGNGASGNGSSRSGWSIFFYSPTNQFYFYRYDGSTETTYTFSFTPSTLTWYHIAVSRSGTSLRFFVDGVQIGSTVTTSVSYNAINTQPLTIGKFIHGSADSVVEYHNGYIDDLRITKGVARYTSNFTPPTASLPDGATQWVDVIGSNNGTLINGPTYSSADGGSIVFDGTNDYVTISDDSDFTFGTGDLTVEAWFKPDSSATVTDYHTMISCGWPLQLYWQDTQFRFWASTANSAAYFVDGSSFSSGSNSAVRDVWHHIVVTRSGSDFKMYLNGVLVDSASSSSSFGDPNVDTAIGRSGVSNTLFADGKISNLKVYKGKGLTATEVAQNYNATKGRYGL